MFTLWKILAHRNTEPRCAPCDPVAIDCRVGLTDIDLNLHLNNARYLKYMDRARLENLLATGLMWKFLRARVNPIITNTEISYIRELRTWQPFSVSAQLIGIDEKYIYFEQRFSSGDALCTHAFTRFACVHKGRSQPAPEVFARLGITLPETPLPAPILAWKAMLDAKKQYALRKPAITENARHVA